MVEEETSVEKSKQFWKDLVQRVKDYAKEFGGKEGEDYVFRKAEYSDKYKKPFFGFIKKGQGDSDAYSDLSLVLFTPEKKIAKKNLLLLRWL